MNTKNYESVNPVCDTSQNWCLSCKFLSTMKQVTVQFADGVKYNYISRFPVEIGDIAIIGNEFSHWTGQCTSAMKTTGLIGVVTEVLPKVEINKSYAAELDFVFSKKPVKTLVNNCAKYLDMDDYEKILQFSKHTEWVRPITHFVRRLLAASSILANQKFASPEEIRAAKQCLQEKPIINVDSITELFFGPPDEWVTIDFEQVFFCSDYTDIKLLLSNQNDYESEDIVLDSWNTSADLYLQHLSDPVLQEYVARSSYLGAASIMARGGFLNLLCSFVDEKPLYSDFSMLADKSESVYTFEEIKDKLKSV